MVFINVAGFFSSGSSAVVDLLKEFKGFYECEAEIRIIKDPYGISQMEYALVNSWELINSSAAINDFIELCNICSRTGGGKNPFARAGLNYEKTINTDFMKIVQEYVDSLTKFQYKSDFYYAKFKKSYFRYITDRIRAGIEIKSKGKIQIANRTHLLPSYFAHPTQEEFNMATQDFFEKLYEPFEKQGSHIILDQAVSANNPQVIKRYFKDSKLIIIDRDPRDMYIEDVVKWGENLDDDPTSVESGMRYVMRQKALREAITEDEDILYIKFEDLILDYNSMVPKILSFLGLRECGHVKKREFLKPEVSANNIGIWEKYYDKYKCALDIIKAQLPDLCFN